MEFSALGRQPLSGCRLARKHSGWTKGKRLVLKNFTSLPRPPPSTQRLVPHKYRHHVLVRRRPLQEVPGSFLYVSTGRSIRRNQLLPTSKCAESLGLTTDYSEALLAFLRRWYVISSILGSFRRLQMSRLCARLRSTRPAIEDFYAGETESFD